MLELSPKTLALLVALCQEERCIQVGTAGQILFLAGRSIVVVTLSTSLCALKVSLE